MSADTHLAIEAGFRIESARLIAGLSRLVRDVGVAEELVGAGAGRSGRSVCAELERAASLTQNERERKLLLDRAAACASS